ncbi:bifunctional phosphopantothenoylcysteine decarboxylase/phosphopantothenate--cysteine ligase CoaBC [bacterium]|nr:bifunctional phosphopantothenoylcysteine decarboxylase/phosphopantothenate--cysteine ligase CoaBC [bacterium]NSW96486.1 bifunctional phosphopantothenoylcysteine decarboxylase/phosphopantothenate--cysteine ligase CoaBC [bacterium]|tara:strand:+ start:24009 stop:25211 length:1203 start_codon:yes stop_codon:yes gene_type:complete
MIKDLNGKNILLGVTGGISAYKSCELSRLLIKDGADVNVVMTSNAEKFVSALTFQYLTGNKVSNDMYDVSDPKISHIDLADKADLIIICPATANFISKFANGIADNLLLNILLATKVQIIVCPAMNVNMYENKIIQENITRLKKNGVIFIEPETGQLACGWEGKGRLAEIENILKFIKKKLQNKTLINENILITAGATREYLDAVRFISNPSSGIMGQCLADEFKNRGARINIIAGHTEVDLNRYDNYFKVNSADEMKNEIDKKLNTYSIIIKAAAVGDFKFKNKKKNKIKKDDNSFDFQMEKNIDVLKAIGQRKTKNQILVGFSAETDNVVRNAKKKIKNKNLDFIVANDISKKGSGFGSKSNFTYFVDSHGSVEELGLKTKEKIAKYLADKIEIMRQN